jgi:hypothetical protein
LGSRPWKAQIGVLVMSCPRQILGLAGVWPFAEICAHPFEPCA